MPAFRTKKQVFDWIKTGDKTIELRKGRSQKGENIAFLNWQGEIVKGRILRKHEGTLEDVLNSDTYRKIVPTAMSLKEAFVFVKRIYPLTQGTFTAYEFQLK